MDDTNRFSQLSQMHSLQNTSKLHLTCTKPFIDERICRGTRSREAQMLRLWAVMQAKQNKLWSWRFQFAYYRKLNFMWNWVKILQQVKKMCNRGYVLRVRWRFRWMEGMYEWWSTWLRNYYNYNGDWFCVLWKCTSKSPMFLFCDLWHLIFLNVTNSIFRTSMTVSKKI